MTKPIRFTDSSGEFLARDNVVMAFFGKSPFSEMADGAKRVFDKYLNLIPQDALKWSIIGMNTGTFKPVTQQALRRCASLLEKGSAEKKDVHFQLMGSQKWVPDYCFTVTGYKKPEKVGFLDPANLVEMIFPRKVLEEYGEETLVKLANDLLAVLPCDSGYVSIALCANESAARKAGAFIAPLALRSHGLDIASNTDTSSSMGSRCRGARWLTMLSTELADQVGGLKAFKQKLPKEVIIHESPKGVLLQAGKTPEIGDVNQNERTPLLASVAHVIEKITYFHDNSLLPIFGSDPERRDRWERRFWVS